jgi:hypothetical protein
MGDDALEREVDDWREALSAAPPLLELPPRSPGW